MSTTSRGYWQGSKGYGEVVGPVEPCTTCGDNLDILREYIPDEAVNLIYLDPSFESKQDYNVLSKERDGTKSAAQIRAFEDTWH